MFQTIAKPQSVRSCFDVNTNTHGNPCFRTWPTCAMFTYFQNEICVSAEDTDNSSERRDRNQHKEQTETIRTKLQDLLRDAYEEAGKAKLADRKMA